LRRSSRSPARLDVPSSFTRARRPRTRWRSSVKHHRA
jgi:hypothetical protein